LHQESTIAQARAEGYPLTNGKTTLTELSVMHIKNAMGMKGFFNAADEHQVLENWFGWKVKKSSCLIIYELQF
jgi:hypothetical protein